MRAWDSGRDLTRKEASEEAKGEARGEESKRAR
jgi:hypothetical protein